MGVCMCVEGGDGVCMCMEGGGGVCMCGGEWCVHVCGYVCMCVGGEWCVHVCGGRMVCACVWGENGVCMCVHMRQTATGMLATLITLLIQCCFEWLSEHQKV